MKSLFISIIVSVVFLSMMVGCKNRTDETFLNTIQKTRIYIPYKKMYNVNCSRYAFDLYSLWFFEVLSHTVYLIGYGVLCLLLAICMYAGGRADIG